MNEKYGEWERPACWTQRPENAEKWPPCQRCPLKNKCPYGPDSK